MAINLAQLAGELRLGNGLDEPPEPVRGILNRLLGVAEALVEVSAGAAPTLVRDEATVRVAAYLYDQPTSSAGDRYAAAWRNSGAENLTTKFVTRRAVVGADEDTGSVTVARVKELIAEALAEALSGVLRWR